MWKIYLIEFIIVLAISIFWVIAIDRAMSENPDYKGEDFLNEDENNMI